MLQLLYIESSTEVTGLEVLSGWVTRAAAKGRRADRLLLWCCDGDRSNRGSKDDAAEIALQKTKRTKSEDEY